MPIKNPAQTNIRYEVITQEDAETGDLMLPIPQPILDQMGWKEGDELKFGLNPDGTMLIERLNK